MVTEQRPAETMEAIQVSGAADLTVQCSAEPSIEVTIDDNLSDVIVTEVSDKKLRVYSTMKVIRRGTDWKSTWDFRN